LHNLYCISIYYLQLEEDLLNYTRFRIYGGYLKLKPDTIPRFFDCQPDRKTARTLKPRSTLKKLTHKRNVAEILSENKLDKENAVKKMKLQSEQSNRLLGCDLSVQDTSSQSRSPLRNVLNDCDTLNVDENENVINDCESAQSVCSLTTSISSEIIKKDISRPSVMHKDKTIQVKSFYRSKYVSCNIRKPVVDASCSPIKMVVVDKVTSPIAISPIRLNKPCEKVVKTIVYESSSTSAVITTSQSEYEPSSDEKVEAEKAEKSNV